ncbi:hypothetical protein B9Z65_854 [Elsinoe australis]|uniref:NAD-dependent epimerase/dehydratase domain-containing protein n=1 Tax=Elsinoe australis TaxID=40998 RepID=A0A2P8AJT8_9PEZI|nr:hypothetical protein B9Z65_854 [Elsinoe australis]
MAPEKLFITGATGYIGGSVLNEALQRFPNLEFSALMRLERPDFTSRYPQVKIIKGSFDDSETISTASEEAEIVIHAGDIDHPGCAAAIIAGLKRKTTPSFVLHLTGTGCISDELTSTYDGSLSPKVWNDVSDIFPIYDLPNEALHHTIDKQFMDLAPPIHSACIVPPDIYGSSTGVGGTESFLIPRYVRAVKEKGEAFYLGKGENMRAVTHIDDVVEAFMILLGEAVKGDGSATWGREGFYFVVADEIAWKDAANAVNEILMEKDLLPKGSKAVSWDKDRLGQLLPSNPRIVLYLWDSNSRAESGRMRTLGWEPKGPSFWEILPVDTEAAFK